MDHEDFLGKSGVQGEDLGNSPPRFPLMDAATQTKYVRSFSRITLGVYVGLAVMTLAVGEWAYMQRSVWLGLVSAPVAAWIVHCELLWKEGRQALASEMACTGIDAVDCRGLISELKGRHVSAG